MHEAAADARKASEKVSVSASRIVAACNVRIAIASAGAGVAAGQGGVVQAGPL